MIELSFVSRTNERRLPEGYDGDILVWDIDKTYLDTHFSSFRGLLRIPLELAVDKEAIPGTVPLLRALRRGPGSRSALVPLYFISGSPIQLRSIIQKKMTLDGVDYDGLTMKDQWGLVRARRPRDVKAQVGYKLKALLAYREEMSSSNRWLLFGDDTESDAQVFALFGEVCRGLRGATLEGELRGHRTHEKDIAEIRGLSDRLPVGADPVEKIFIHLAARSDPERFSDPRLVATHSYLQTALVLASMGRIPKETIAVVARDLRLRHTTEADIGEQLVDAEHRLRVGAEWTALARAPSST
jgi:hypothetical protein